MDITSPFFVVPLIVAVFVAAILFATSTKEDGHESH
jgi:paraquat-inducible protein B